MALNFDGAWNIKKEIEKYLVKNHNWVDDPSSRQIIHTAYNHVESAVELSKRVFGTNYRRGTIEGIIRDALCKLKGAIESHVSKKMDLEEEIDIFTQKIHELEENYADDLYKFPGGGDGDGDGDEDEDEYEEVASNGDKSKMIGFSDHYKHLKERLTYSDRFHLKERFIYSGRFHLKQRLTFTDHFQVVSLSGMPGIGKTTLAREIFEDPDIVEQFPCRVWVKVGRKCGFKEMLRRVLTAVSPDHQMRVGEDEDVIGWLNERLKGKTYLIVLDDVWDRYVSICFHGQAYSFRRNELIHIFPHETNGSRVLVTRRMEDFQRSSGKNQIEMRLMDKEESWHLLRDKVFDQERCPYELEKIGRKIAEKCEGLPLTIVTVANLLSKENKTVEFWNEIATRRKHPLFNAAYDEILKVLLPSYINLPRFLQMCFMYMGVFPRYYDVRRSEIISVWLVDEFLQHYGKSSTHYGELECLEELVSNNMVMIRSKTITYGPVGERKIKTCRLHTALWHLSNREARRSKFSYVLECLEDGLGEDIQSQPRLSFHNNVLFAIKDVHESVENSCASTAHSLFCYGPYLPYQVPICFGLRLLNRLDALTIRLYEFPLEVLQLIELRYLALTMNGNLPPAISQLSKLQFLIVHPHQSIKSFKESSYLPMEIWDMEELQHLQVMGKDLPNPCGASLKKLRTISRVGPYNCSVEIFKGIRDIKKLGIQVELSHENDSELLSCLAHVSHLEKLQSLKCVVVNPKSIPSFYPLSSFPIGLKKLTLNGLGYAWEEMNKIGSLPVLMTLKLQNYAFRGPEWNIREGQLHSLRSLTIEDTDMEIWRNKNKLSFIRNLIIKRCYKLKEIDGFVHHLLKTIEMVDCNPLGTQQIRDAAGRHVEVRVSCSWYDKK